MTHASKPLKNNAFIISWMQNLFIIVLESIVDVLWSNWFSSQLCCVLGYYSKCTQLVVHGVTCCTVYNV